MRVVMFCHSLVSDWNHGDAHFLRGIAGELKRRGHGVQVYEPADAWSVDNLLSDHGESALDGFARAYPHLRSFRYGGSFDVEGALRDVDLAIVHEWNEPALVARIGEVRRRNAQLRLLFHDTHHRPIADSLAPSVCDLRHYDGVLACGRVIRIRYLSEGWARKAWTWHEAADTHVFHPRPRERRQGDLVWIGNWADGERADELREFLLEPVERLRLRATVYGVRYPAAALQELQAAGIRYGGWLPNYEVPRVFAGYSVTVHFPSRLSARALPGIPTIRPFEALACGIPLVSAPWEDVEGLFRPGRDFLVAEDGDAMTAHLAAIIADPTEATSVAQSGLLRIHCRHTCAHRVDELLSIHHELLHQPQPVTEVQA